MKIGDKVHRLIYDNVYYNGIILSFKDNSKKECFVRWNEVEGLGLLKVEDLLSGWKDEK